MRILIDEKYSGKRLDQALAELCPEISRARLQKHIKNGCCKIGNETIISPATKLHYGQALEFKALEKRTSLKPEFKEIEVIYEDSDIAIINKSPNLTVHPCPSCEENTLAQRLLARFPQLQYQEGDRPGIVHRLDKDTSGLMLVALSEKARQKLISDFAERKIQKQYLALVFGKPPITGHCDKAIGRHPTLKTRMAILGVSHGGKSAETEWQKLWQAADKSCALLKVRIKTGRTHQIRVHLADSGFPILGDKLYAPNNIGNKAPRQMLHSWHLGFGHPISGKQLDFYAPLPGDFFQCLQDHDKQMQRIAVTGNQGCGKSSFCRVLARLGMPCISADDIVARLYSDSPHVKDWLRHNNMASAITEKGDIDKSRLMQLMNRSPELRADLERFIHALVFDEIEAFWKNCAKKGEPFALAEIPLYFESNAQTRFNPKPLVIGVACPQETRWSRIMSNRGWTREKTATMESWQLPEQRKMSLCDIVVNNDGNFESLAQKADELFANLKTQAMQPSFSAQLDEILTKARD